ncbi:MAG: aspartate kinase [archaeon]|jgi:aspartate kinase
MEKIVVLKIGGGILRDKDSFLRVVNIISNKKNLGEKQIVVISALFGVTDFLIDSMSKCALGKTEVMSIINSLKETHLQYLSFIDDLSIRQKAEFALNEKISLLEKFLFGISYLKEISPRSKDFIQSFGERLSPIVLEAFLLNNKIATEFIDAEEAGIICEGNFENALAVMPKTTTNLQNNVLPLLSGKVVLLPGYYGVDELGEVKTFGRGGTDYSSGFIANIFDARLEIWKDVSGFMTADPKVIPSAKQIPLLSYDEAEELGYLGAKILHPKTIAPLREKALCAEIKNVFAPEVLGTIICGEKDSNPGIVKSIAPKKDISVISIESIAMINFPGFASGLFSILSESGISVDLIVTSEASISFSVETKFADAAFVAIEEIKKVYPSTISMQKNLAMISVIGEGMKNSYGVAGKVFSALGAEKVNVELISQGASEINISFVVKKEDLERAMLVVHEEFFN